MRLRMPQFRPLIRWSRFFLQGFGLDTFAWSGRVILLESGSVGSFPCGVVSEV